MNVMRMFFFFCVAFFHALAIRFSSRIHGFFLLRLQSQNESCNAHKGRRSQVSISSLQLARCGSRATAQNRGRSFLLNRWTLMGNPWSCEAVALAIAFFRCMSWTNAQGGLFLIADPRVSENFTDRVLKRSSSSRLQGEMSSMIAQLHLAAVLCSLRFFFSINRTRCQCSILVSMASQGALA